MTINQSVVIFFTFYLMENVRKGIQIITIPIAIRVEKTKARLTTSVPSINYVLSRLLLGKLRCPFLVQEGVERCRKNSPMGYGIIPLGCAARCLGWQISPLGCEISCLELQKKLDSPTRLAIMTHVSFHLMTEYCNSASLTCASKCREKHRNWGFLLSFEA